MMALPALRASEQLDNDPHADNRGSPLDDDRVSIRVVMPPYRSGVYGTAGKITVVWHATVGAFLRAGEPLIVADSNLGRIEIGAGIAGTAHQVFVKEGGSLSAEQPLADFEPEDSREQEGSIPAVISGVIGDGGTAMHAAHADDGKPTGLGHWTMDHKTALGLVGAIVIVGFLGWLVGLIAFFLYGGAIAPIAAAVSLAAVAFAVRWGKSHSAALKSSSA